MTNPTTYSLTNDAKKAGYLVISVEQLRPNRWLLQLLDGQGATTLLVVQARPLITASDIQDVAELVRLRSPRYGILLAYGGIFSPIAQRTFIELGDHRLRLCTVLPPALAADVAESRPVIASAKSSA